MPWQLIYTSAARGLTPGQSGYCTVARSRDLREALIPRLEKLSYYTHEGARGAAICAHRILELRGAHYHVLTRITDAGHDFTKRRKFLAHHLIFEAQELREFPNPAELFLNSRGWRNDWMSDPDWIEGFTPNLSAISSASAWEPLTGSPKNAAALLQFTGWITGDDQERRLFLPALAESLRNYEKAWEITFTNCFQPGDDPADFRICAVWPGTAGFEKSLQLEAAAARLRELRPRSEIEAIPAEVAPKDEPALAPSQSTPKTNLLWPALAGVITVAALLAAVYFRSRPEQSASAPAPSTSQSPEPIPRAPDAGSQVDVIFPAKPTWIAAGQFRELGAAPDLQRTFRMLKDAELFGKDLRATLQEKPAAIDVRAQDETIAISNNGVRAQLRATGSDITFTCDSKEAVTVELNSKDRFMFIPDGGPLMLSQSLVNADTNAEKVELEKKLGSRLQSFTLPPGTQWSLRPRDGFPMALEKEFGLAASTDFDFGAIRSQVKRIVHEKEKRVAILRKELESLRAEDKQQLTDSLSSERKERLAALKLAEPRWENELKELRAKAESLPKEFSSLRDYSLFISDGESRAEVIRFAEGAL